MAPRRSAPLAAVFATILILIGFVIFLLVYGDLRRLLWVQGMVGVIMALIVAVILFSIVYSVVEVEKVVLWGVVVSGGGAAIFYFLILPQIKPFFFPTHAIAGYVFYKDDPKEPLTAVPGVVAVVPTTGQKSAPSDNSGRFVIEAVYSDETSMQFEHGGKTYPVLTTNYPDGRYPVIPRPRVEPSPQKRSVTVSWKKNAAYKCDKEGYTSATGYTLVATLAKNDEEVSRGAKKLHLKVTLAEQFGDITQPGDMQPGNSIDFLEDGDKAGRSQGWEWAKIDENQPNIKVGICVSRKDGNQEPAAANFETTYWYGVLR